ncbi:hypothetical protein BDV23DRAFT_165902 [Aspergillus alliaceus]|uniref:Uncharacterized protein n=1 Tax=Petromyces alliaceus TaxID=209559 RepID=A0A5N7BSV1_PETAA|nr:hypothetical protein BDV23DRAFT_165902 [Aspergillus alliaceus]
MGHLEGGDAGGFEAGFEVVEEGLEVGVCSWLFSFGGGLLLVLTYGVWFIEGFWGLFVFDVDGGWLLSGLGMVLMLEVWFRCCRLGHRDWTGLHFPNDQVSAQH